MFRSREEEFIGAMKVNNHLRVRALLAEGVKPDEILASIGDTPLCYVARMGSHKVAEELLCHGAGVNKISSQGNTPLHVAASNGCNTVVKVLISHCAEINTTNDEGFTPLHAAIDRRNGEYIEVVKDLLANGARVDITSTNGWSPLYTAAFYGLPEVVKALLKSGADVNFSPPSWIETSLYAAIFRFEKLANNSGCADVVLHLLLAGADVNTTYNAHTVDYYAAKNKWTSVVRWLVVNQGMPSWVTESPALTDTCHPDFELVQFFIEVKVQLDLEKSYAANGIRLWSLDPSLYFSIIPKDPLLEIVAPMVLHPSLG